MSSEETTKTEKTKPTPYAFVMLCMKGDAYAPGVIVMAESIRATSKMDIICMCTPDVSETARADIATVARVHSIEYIRYDTKRMKTKRQMELYGAWLSEAYTKWRCLELTDYKKVLFVDADMIVVQSIDHLFELHAPAGTFSTPWAKEYAAESCFDLRGYPRDHGARVTAKSIQQTFSRGNGYTMIASMVLLEPNLKDFEGLCATVNAMQPFGLDNWSTPDEQSLTYYLAVTLGRDWTHIHQRYNAIIRKINWLTSTRNGETFVAVPHVLHYFSSTKPWQMKNAISESPYPTDMLWWSVLKKWANRTGRTLGIDRFQEMLDTKKWTIRPSRMINDYFPWIVAMKIPFPEIF